MGACCSADPEAAARADGARDDEGVVAAPAPAAPAPQQRPMAAEAAVKTSGDARPKAAAKPQANAVRVPNIAADITAATSEGIKREQRGAAAARGGEADGRRFAKRDLFFRAALTPRPRRLPLSLSRARRRFDVARLPAGAAHAQRARRARRALRPVRPSVWQPLPQVSNA
jgi:hypothetical protein